jgi:hypothetical protein
MNIAELVFAAITSGSDGLRAFQNKLPRKGEAMYVLPMIAISTITGHTEMHLSGDGGLRRYLIQLDAWASTRRGADDYMELAREKMLAATTFKIGAIEVTGADGYDEEANLYRTSVEFGLWVNQ